MIELIKIGTETFISMPGNEYYHKTLVNISTVVSIHILDKNMLPMGKTLAVSICCEPRGDSIRVYDDTAKSLLTILGIG